MWRKWDIWHNPWMFGSWLCILNARTRFWKDCNQMPWIHWPSCSLRASLIYPKPFGRNQHWFLQRLGKLRARMGSSRTVFFSFSLSWLWLLLLLRRYSLSTDRGHSLHWLTRQKDWCNQQGCPLCFEPQNCKLLCHHSHISVIFMGENPTIPGTPPRW